MNEDKQIDLAELFVEAPLVVQPKNAPTVAARKAAEQRRVSKVSDAYRAKGGKPRRLVKALKIIMGLNCVNCKGIYAQDRVPFLVELCAICWPEDEAVHYWSIWWGDFFAGAIEKNNFSCSTRSSAYHALQMVGWLLEDSEPCDRQRLWLASIAGLKLVRNIRHKGQLDEWKVMLMPLLGGLAPKAPPKPKTKPAKRPPPEEGPKQLTIFG